LSSNFLVGFLHVLGKWNDLENARIPSKEEELKATEALKENCMYKVISSTFTTKEEVQYRPNLCGRQRNLRA
jgi:hypothetical protein